MSSIYGIKTKVYIAGPYSHPDPVKNMHSAIHMGNKVLDAEYCPFIPHLTGFWHLICPHPYEDWLAYDLEWLAACDVLLRMPGCSAGADLEVRYAQKNGIPVVWSFHELLRDMPNDRSRFQTKFPARQIAIEEPPNSQTLKHLSWAVPTGLGAGRTL